jgi:hypothetical protein
MKIRKSFTALGPGPLVMILFAAVIYVRYRILVRSRAYHRVEQLIGFPIGQALVLVTRLERDKGSSLFCSFENYGRKKVL